jgi:hypothetical protein
MAIITPYVQSIFDYSNLNELFHSIGSFISILLQGNSEALTNVYEQIISTWEKTLAFFSLNVGKTTIIILSLLLIGLVKQFLGGIGNYTATAVVNDNMALQAKSPFFSTLVKNLGRASLYSLIYVPLSAIYDIAFFTLGFYIFFVWMAFVTFPYSILLPLLFTVYSVLVIATKMTFTGNWLPALVVGKCNNRKAMRYTFSPKNKLLGSNFLQYVVLVILIFAANMAAIWLTFGAGLLLTVPSSYLILIAFQLVNYCDTNNIKYFIDRDTIVKPAKEKVRSRQDFFKGE